MSNKKDSNVYMIHRGLAVLLDILVVVVFIAVGQKEHESSLIFGDYVRIALPFLAAFFAVQLIMGKDQRSLKYCAIAGAIAVPLAIFIRVVEAGQPSYEFKPAFFIVSFLFMNAGWLLWRFALNKLRPVKND